MIETEGFLQKSVVNEIHIASSNASDFIFYGITEDQSQQLIILIKHLINGLISMCQSDARCTASDTQCDRLRAVQCPSDITNQIGGWTTDGVGQGYDSGYHMSVLELWLR